MEGVNSKLKGKRAGEITLLISGTGSGKSTLLREDMLFTLQNTTEDVKIGVLSLEEDPAETTRKLIGMYLKRNPADEPIEDEDLLAGFDELFGSGRVVMLDHQGIGNGDYWSSTPHKDFAYYTNYHNMAYHLLFANTDSGPVVGILSYVNMANQSRLNGLSIRCIKD